MNADRGLRAEAIFCDVLEAVAPTWQIAACATTEPKLAGAVALANPSRAGVRLAQRVARGHRPSIRDAETARFLPSAAARPSGDEDARAGRCRCLACSRSLCADRARPDGRQPSWRGSANRIRAADAGPARMRAGKVALKESDREETNDQHAQDDAGSCLAAHGSCA